MRPFLTEDFLLQTRTARALYHEFAENMPIFDYHCHLPVAEITANKTFENLTDIWLRGDHYKWRAMRANGISERLITGDASDFEKFQAWAATVPKTLRNPLYHWTHLELKRYFGVSGRILNPETAQEIYTECSAMLRTGDFSTRRILERMNVKVVCTTDDPVDMLEHHLRLREDRTFPFAMAAEVPAFNGPPPPTKISGYVPGKIVVRFDPATLDTINRFPEKAAGRLGIPTLDQLAEQHGVFHIQPQFPGAKKRTYKGRALDLAGWHIVRFKGKADVRQLAAAYKAHPGVLEAQPVSYHSISNWPNDQFFSQEFNNQAIEQWHLKKIQAPAAWDYATGNSQIIVALLDTGVKYYHKDLGGLDGGYNNAGPSAIAGNIWLNQTELGGTPPTRRAISSTSTPARFSTCKWRRRASWPTWIRRRIICARCLSRDTLVCHST